MSLRYSRVCACGLTAAMIVLMLGGCGKKGRLYLPPASSGLAAPAVVAPAALERLRG